MSSKLSIPDFLQKRAEKFVEHLHSRGMDFGEASILRNCVRALSPLELAKDADAPDLPAPKVDEKLCTADFPISTVSKDRMGDIILPKGCLRLLPHNYSRNPRVFFSHQSRDLPIASARHPDGSLAVEVSEFSIWSRAYFHMQTAESEQIFHLVAAKELQAASIGFLPVKAAVLNISRSEERPETNEFGEDLIYFEDGGFFPCLRFHEWDLTEWSVVPVPANADCISMHLSRGTIAGSPISDGLKSLLEPYKKPKKWYSPGALLERSLALPLLSPSVKGETTPPPPVVHKPKAAPASELLSQKDCAAGCQDPCNPKLLGLPDIRQEDNYSCGAAASMAVGKFFGVGPDTLEEWKAALGTSVEYSTHPNRIAEYLQSLGLHCECKQNMSLEDLKCAWLQGSPVITPVQDYFTSFSDQAKFNYGHYLTVIGVALEHVFCQDSSADNAIYDVGDTLAAPGRVMIRDSVWMTNWHDQDVDGNKFIQFGIIVSRPAGSFTPALETPKMAAAPAASDLMYVPVEFPKEAPVGSVVSLKFCFDDTNKTWIRMSDSPLIAPAGNSPLPTPAPNPSTHPGEGNNPTPADMDDWPHGAKFLHCAMSDLADHVKMVGEHEPKLEHTRVKRRAAKHKALSESLHGKLHKLAHELYPEKFAAPPTDPAAAEQDSKESPEGIPQNPSPEVAIALSAPAEPDWSLVLQAVQSITDSQKKLDETFFELTGRRTL